ncbi:helix-turn-helix transcriptional regulator [Enterobacter kobei]|nr:helix-turn-helix transcriptional regulator [Enterobacter kobei]
MIRCNLSTLMDKKKAGLKITTVARETGINRNTLALLFHNTAVQVDLMVLEILCCYFDCPLTDLIQHQQDKTLEELNAQWDYDKTSRKESAKEKAKQRKPKKSASKEDHNSGRPAQLVDEKGSAPSIETTGPGSSLGLAAQGTIASTLNKRYGEMPRRGHYESSPSSRWPDIDTPNVKKDPAQKK